MEDSYFRKILFQSYKKKMDTTVPVFQFLFFFPFIFYTFLIAFSPQITGAYFDGQDRRAFQFLTIFFINL